MISVPPASGAAAAPEGAPSAAALSRVEQLAARVEAALPATLTRVANATGELTFEVRPAQLLAAATNLHDEHPDDNVVIVVGSSSQAAHRLVGSVAVSLARRSPVPVIIVP